MRFFKNGCNGERWEIFTRQGGKPGRGRGGGGVGFLMEGWEIFKVSFHSWWRGANLPILWRPPYIATPLFKFCPIPSHTSFLPPTPTLTVLFIVIFLWLNGWSEWSWCMFYATRRQVGWGVTHNMVLTGTLIWYHTHTNINSTLRGQ